MNDMVLEAARVVAAQHDRGDTELVHLSRRAAAFLAKHFGGDVNDDTGLPQFDFWSSAGHAVGGLFGLGGGSGSNPGDPGGQAYNDLRSQAQPLLDAGKQTLAQYTSGQLRPGDQLALNQSVQGQDAQLKQFYANAGLGSSSMLINQEGSVANEAQITRQKILDSYLQQAVAAYGTAFQPLSEAIKYEFLGNQQAQSNVSGLLGGIFGGGGGGMMGSIGSWFGGLFGGGGTDLAGFAAGEGASAGLSGVI